jgi:hypothetical protein
MEEFNIYGELMDFANGYISLSGFCGEKRYRATVSDSKSILSPIKI